MLSQSSPIKALWMMGVAFIQKPFSIADLMEKLREVLDVGWDKKHE